LPGWSELGKGLPGTAWATLQHAADVVGPGDTVHVSNGDYAGFYVSSSGTSGNPITFLAESPAVRITADNASTPDGINIEGVDHVVIDGFTLDGRTRAGIRTAVSHFVTIRNCHAGYNGHWGIFSGFAYDLTIENNEAHHSTAEHGIYTSNSGDRPIIRGNLVHDNQNCGIHMNGDRTEGGDGLISDALVERNIVYGNGTGGGSGINMDGVVDSVVRNNLLYDNHSSGISLFRIDGATGSTGNLIVNNTIINASDARWCVNINTGSTANTVVNNILYNYHPWRGVITIDGSSRTGFVSDYNSVMERFSNDGGDDVLDLAAWRALGYDAHSLVAAPSDNFVSPGTDFHLLDTSPAIDGGTSAGAPAQDLEGNPRPVGGGVDVGAYEVQLLHCGDGTTDPGEQCGEPGLTCTDPCTTCARCVCMVPDPVCGDGTVCGDEACELDGDCLEGQVCEACRCVAAPVCTSGIEVEKPVLKMTAEPFSLRFKGQAVIARPWIGIDPVVNGVRIVIRAGDGSSATDVMVPGGAYDGVAGWTVNGDGTRSLYRDPAGTVGGITRVIVKDSSRKVDGLLRWVVKGSGTAAALPNAADVRGTIVLGTADECAAIRWNPPGGDRPRCQGDAARLRCG
jgi:parallel beta-helix repeat protein